MSSNCVCAANPAWNRQRMPTEQDNNKMCPSDSWRQVVDPFLSSTSFTGNRCGGSRHALARGLGKGSLGRQWLGRHSQAGLSHRQLWACPLGPGPGHLTQSKKASGSRGNTARIASLLSVYTRFILKSINLLSN